MRWKLQVDKESLQVSLLFLLGTVSMLACHNFTVLSVSGATETWGWQLRALVQTLSVVTFLGSVWLGPVALFQLFASIGEGGEKVYHGIKAYRRAQQERVTDRSQQEHEVVPAPAPRGTGDE